MLLRLAARCFETVKACKHQARDQGGNRWAVVTFRGATGCQHLLLGCQQLQGDKMHTSLPAAHADGMCWAAAYRLFTKGCRRVSGCHQQAHMHGEQAALSRDPAHFWKHCWALPANHRGPMSGACPSHQKQGAGSADSLRLPVCTTSVWHAKLNKHSSMPSSQESRDWPLVAAS